MYAYIYGTKRGFLRTEKISVNIVTKGISDKDICSSGLTKSNLFDHFYLKHCKDFSLSKSWNTIRQINR